MNWLSIIRNVLTLAGAFLLGHNLFGLEVNESLWQEITGGIMVLAGVVLSILDKTLTIEKWQGALRHVALVVGGLLIAKGVLKPEQIEAILGVVTALGTILYGYLSKKKSQEIVANKIPTTQLNQ